MPDNLSEEKWREAWQLFQAGGDVPAAQVGAYLSRLEASPEVRDVVARMLLANDSLVTGPHSDPSPEASAWVWQAPASRLLPSRPERKSTGTR